MNYAVQKPIIVNVQIFFFYIFNRFFFVFISGPNSKTAIAILNCILARQFCFEDPSCSAILEIIPRVCGPVPGKSILLLLNIKINPYLIL